jgi:hypothetical protein
MDLDIYSESVSALPYAEPERLAIYVRIRRCRTPDAYDAQESGTRSYGPGQTGSIEILWTAVETYDNNSART